jgi:quercetin 2,3-dioxygenase
MKTVLGSYSDPEKHWVGDGFPVRILFDEGAAPKATRPFLLLDFAGPAILQPATMPRGVGRHPHRGFETVTIFYDREVVVHRRSTGTGGIVGPSHV